MSSYFDAFDSRLSKADNRELSTLEEELVRDVSICSEIPGFPAALIPTLHRILMTYSVATRDRYLPESDVDSEDDHRRAIGNMSSALHTLFHSVSRLGLPGFTDNPLTPLRHLESNAEEYRRNLYLARYLGDNPKCPYCERSLYFSPATYSDWVDEMVFRVPVQAWSCAKGCTGALWTDAQREEYDRLLGYEILRTGSPTPTMVRFILARSLRATEEVLGKFKIPEDDVPITDPEFREHLMDLLVEKGREK